MGSTNATHNPTHPGHLQALLHQAMRLGDRIPTADHKRMRSISFNLLHTTCLKSHPFASTLMGRANSASAKALATTGKYGTGGGEGGHMNTPKYEIFSL